jgi:RimJ/RimL family protein N-acetyltransferase
MEITCASCVLRPLVPSDAATLARHANDREVWRNLRDRFPHPYSQTDATDWIAAVAGREVQTSFGIVVGDEAIGSISLVLGDDIARCSAEIGYWIGREYWGRGIMPEAVRAVTCYGFDELRLLRVFAVPFARTWRSARVLEKVGYAYEGLMRRSAIKEGEILDQHLYAAYDDRPLPTLR